MSSINVNGKFSSNFVENKWEYGAICLIKGSQNFLKIFENKIQVKMAMVTTVLIITVYELIPCPFFLLHLQLNSSVGSYWIYNVSPSKVTY